ncbi:MAG: type II toxin-antitoxin system RelE/ParE family toxin [Oceanicaulis sp.]
MARRIKYADAALADLAQLTRYGAMEFGVDAARRYAMTVRSAVRLAAEFPLAGAAAGDAAVRSITSKSHRIFYRADAESLTVVRILHVRQLPPGFE